MKAVQYDEQELIRSLDRLPPKLKAVFAAACAQRLLPAYADFTRVSGRGDPERLAGILERVWSTAGGTLMPEAELSEALEACMSLIPAEDDTPWFDEQAYAEDAGAAVAYGAPNRVPHHANRHQTRECGWRLGAERLPVASGLARRGFANRPKLDRGPGGGTIGDAPSDVLPS